MFYLALIVAILMILTSLIPNCARMRGLCVVLWLFWVGWWGFVSLALQSLRFPLAIGWLYLFLIIAFPLVRYKKWNWLRFLAIGTGCGVLAFGIALLQFLPFYRQHQELLARYPLADLKPRLAYEEHVTTSSSAKTAGMNVSDIKTLEALYPSVVNDVFHSGEDVEYRRSRRRTALQALMRVHEGYVADFIAQPGVGYARLPGVLLLTKSDLEEVEPGVCLDDLPERLPQPKPEPRTNGTLPLATPGGTGEDNSSAQAFGLTAELQDLLQLHRQNIMNFVPPVSLGGLNGQLQARGFQSHAFRIPPTEPASRRSDLKHWRLVRLELISLLKHDPPAVYVSDHLPAMDELRTAPTRPTTEFENAAIVLLSAGKDLVSTQSQWQEFRMVGSIRASQTCQECHRVPFNSLLGAFTYHLAFVPP